MDKQIDLKQGTVVCQVCGKVIAIIDSKGVKTWYGQCPTDCSEK